MISKSKTIESDLITVIKAAEIMGMTIQAIYGAIKKGWLEPHYLREDCSLIFVERKEILAWKEYLKSPPIPPWRIRDEAKK